MTAQDYLLSGGTPVFYSGNSENLVWCYTFNGVDENLQCYDVSVGKGMLDVSNYDNISSGLTKLTGYNKIKLPDGNIYGLGFNSMLFGSNEQEEEAPKSSTNSITNQQTKYSGLIYYSGSSTQFVDKLNYTTYQDTGGTSASLILVGENDDYSFSNEGSFKAPSFVPAVAGNYLFVIPCNNVSNPFYIGTFLGKDFNDFIILMQGGTSSEGPFE